MKFTNKEILNDVVLSIKESPKTLHSERIKEQDFLDVVLDSNGEVRSNTELGLLVTVEPHTVNNFINVLYDRTVRKGTTDGLNFSNKFEIFKSSNLEQGLQWSVIAVDQYAGEDFDNTASPIGNFASTVGEAVSTPPSQRLVKFTYSRNELQMAFLNEGGIDSLLEAMIKKVRDTIEMEIHDSIKSEIVLTDPATSENENFFTEAIDLSSGDLPEILQALVRTGGKIFSSGVVSQLLTNNADDLLNPLNQTPLSDIQLAGLKELKARILDDVLRMSEKNTTFNLGDPNAGGSFTVSLRKGEGILVINSMLLSALETSADSMFGSESNYKKYFKEIIEVYESGFTDTNEDHMFLYAILDPKAIEYKYLLEKSLTWENPRALYTNYFTHFWWGKLVNPYVSSLVKIAKTS